MEHFGHEAFYLQDELPPGNSNESDLAASAYDSTWPTNAPSVTLSSAPHSCRQDGSDVFPLCEPGTMTCIDPGILHVEISNVPPRGDVCNWNHLETLNNINFSAHSLLHRKHNLQSDPSKQIAIGTHQRYPLRPHIQLNKAPSFQQIQPMSANSHNSGDSGMLKVPPFHEPRLLQRTRILRKSTLPVASEKRTHEALTLENLETTYQPPRSPKIARLDVERTRRDTFHSDYSDDRSDLPNRPNSQRSNHASYRKSVTFSLMHKQKKFVRQWYETFAAEQSRSFPPNEVINALATLTQSTPQSVQEYIEKKYFMADHSTAFEGFRSPMSASLPQLGQGNVSRSGYNLKDANRHLPPHILSLVEKYVGACQRRRAQSDGRRGVNEGPFRCTFGCSYQTKRAFDWRRHEETHEPQELWLCHLCGQNGEQNPFLVNRKDKFLKHVKDTHKGWEPETVLDMSKVDFRANFDPRCPLCPESSATWDDRCRHILTHYEDDIQRGLHRNLARSTSERERSTSGESNRGLHRRSYSNDFSDENASPRSRVRKGDAQQV